MLSLVQDLQEKKISIHDFKKIALRVLAYLPNVLSDFKDFNGYRIHSSNIAGTTKYLRPINQRLFVYSTDDFQIKFQRFEMLLDKMKIKTETWHESDKQIIDSIMKVKKHTNVKMTSLFLHFQR